MESNWISVNDRPPVGDCIVFEANKRQVRFCYESEWEALNWQVTHWMPLPNPPAEKEG